MPLGEDEVEELRKRVQKLEEQASRSWLALPFLFGFVGGILGWIALKGRDDKLAKDCAVVGFVMSLVYIMLTLWVFL